MVLLRFLHTRSSDGGLTVRFVLASFAEFLNRPAFFILDSLNTPARNSWTVSKTGPDAAAFLLYSPSCFAHWSTGHRTDFLAPSSRGYSDDNIVKYRSLVVVSYPAASAKKHDDTP